jgi:L-methionine (R)-S-oxide reductase
MGCLQIPFTKGICGACASTKQIQLVPDISKRPEHIACDSLTNSELVIPVTDRHGDVFAVLDIDSQHINGFALEEAQLLQELLNKIFRN